MNQEDSIRLIEMYAKYRFLWDAKDKVHHNRMKREDAWKKMSAKMQYSVPILKAKMKTLMCSYRSESSREKKAESLVPEHSEKEVPVTPTSPTITPAVNTSATTTSATSTSATTSSSTTHQQMLQETTFPTPNTSRGQRTGIKRKAAEQESDSMMRKAMQILKSSVNSSNDAYVTYALNLANELRKYDQKTLEHKQIKTDGYNAKTWTQSRNELLDTSPKLDIIPKSLIGRNVENGHNVKSVIGHIVESG
ncbi:hypothetical protein FQR65_LT18400 [Abscondita terminalis]|nr:hypothetical protein FQR65_LT18400 [Abscondita terminalis]